MTDREYNKAYWRANRLRLLKERAERYRNDPKYRDAIKSRARAQVAMDRVTRVTKIVRVLHDGTHEPVFSISDVSDAINRKLAVVYAWKKNKIIPPPLYQNGRGKGLYAESQVSFMRDLVQRIDNDEVRIIYPVMGKILQRVWGDKYSPDRLTLELEKELVHEADYERKVSEELDRRTRHSIDSGRRKDRTEERETPKVQGGARRRARKHGNNTEHGELSEPSARGRSRTTMFTCGGRSSFRASF